MPLRRSALAAALALVAPATAAARVPPPWLQLQDGVSRPQFTLADAVQQAVFVETRLDTDRDGRRDRIRIRVRRPGETDVDVPVVFEHSPYRGMPGPARNHDVDRGALPRANLPGSTRATAAGSPAAGRCAEGASTDSAGICSPTTTSGAPATGSASWWSRPITTTRCARARARG